MKKTIKKMIDILTKKSHMFTYIVKNGQEGYYL